MFLNCVNEIAISPQIVLGTMYNSSNEFHTPQMSVIHNLEPPGIAFGPAFAYKKGPYVTLSISHLSPSLVNYSASLFNIF